MNGPAPTGAPDGVARTAGVPADVDQLKVMHVFGGHVRSGVESVVLDLADGLRSMGGTPILVPHCEGEFAEEARGLGFVVRPLGKKRRYDVARIPSMARLIKRADVDIVHSHGVNGAFYACPAGRLAGIASQVCSFHGDTREHLRDIYRSSFPRLMSHHYFLLLTRWCERLICASKALRERLIGDGIEPGRIVAIPNGVDPATYERAGRQRERIRAELGIDAGTTVIGTMARLAAVKDIPMFLEVARHVLAEHPGSRFVIAGDGPDRNALEARAATLGLGEKVVFTGWREDSAEFLSALDVFLLTSLSEDCPIAGLGAMAHGIPVVSTDVGIMQELDELRRLGLTVACGDVDGMTAAVKSLLMDDRKRKLAGRYSRELVVRRFTKAEMVRNTCELYSALRGWRAARAGVHASATGS